MAGRKKDQSRYCISGCCALVLCLLMLAACSGPLAGSDEAQRPDVNTSLAEAGESDQLDDAGASPGTTEPPPPQTIPMDIGNPVFALSAGNLRLRPQTSIAIGFQAPTTATVDSVSFVIKYDDKRPGYHSGNCGQVNVALVPADPQGNPGDQELGRIEIAAPCEGPRTIGWLTTQQWPDPIGLEEGEVYFLVFQNPDPDANNWVSINQLFDRRGFPGPEAGASSWLLARGDSYYSGSEGSAWGHTEVLRQHQPVFELSTSDGAAFGQSFVGVRRSLTLDGQDIARHRFTLDEGIEAHEIRIRPVDPSADAELAYRIVDPDGESLTSGTFAATDSDGWLVAPIEVNLSPNTRYSIEIEARSGFFTFYPVYLATHDDWLSQNAPRFTEPLELSAAGGAWREFNIAIRHDLPLVLSGTTLVDPDQAEQSGQTEDQPTQIIPERIMVVGDSLVSSQTFKESMEETLGENAQLVANDFRPGRTVEAALSEVTSLEPDLDAIVVSLGINGSTTPEQFEDNVRLLLARISELAPDTPILWIDLAALTTRYPNIVADRVEPRNEILLKLEAQDEIVVIRWSDFIASKPEIFAADGVHHHGNEDEFARFVGQELVLLLARMP